MSRKTEFRNLTRSVLSILLKAERCGIIEEFPDGNGWIYYGRLEYKTFFKEIPKDQMFLALLEYETYLAEESQYPWQASRGKW